MKFTKEMRERIIKWVELNGLYPQPCGATLIQLCKACGITWDTFKKWEKKTEFSEALTRAREKFAATTEVEVVNALVKAAKGVDFTRLKEHAAADKQTGELKTVKAYRETTYYPPDVKAATFLLTNLAPDRWKNKQDTVTDLNLGIDEAPVIVFSEKPAQAPEQQDDGKE